MKIDHMYRRQQGAALIISLLLLITLTLLAVAAINTSTVNLRIVGNMQEQRAAEVLVQDAIEQLLSSATFFPTNDNSQPIVFPNGVTIESRECLFWEGADDFTLLAEQLTPQNTLWRVNATVVLDSGARVEIVQGVAIPLLAGNC